MTPTRRLLLAGLWGVPALVCAAVPASALAGEDPGSLDLPTRKRDRMEVPSSCPLCRPGQLCPEHFV